MSVSAETTQSESSLVFGKVVNIASSSGKSERNAVEHASSVGESDCGVAGDSASSKGRGVIVIWFHGPFVLARLLPQPAPTDAPPRCPTASLPRQHAPRYARCSRLGCQASATLGDPRTRRPC